MVVLTLFVDRNYYGLQMVKPRTHQHQAVQIVVLLLQSQFFRQWLAYHLIQTLKMCPLLRILSMQLPLSAVIYQILHQ